MKTKGLSILFIAVLFISVTGFAQKREFKRDQVSPREKLSAQNIRGNRAENFFTEEQKETVQTIRLETAKKIKPLQNQLNELEAKQKTISTAEKPDLKTIYANIDKMADVKTEMAKIHASQQQEIRSLLTKEQLLKFDNFREHRMNFRKENLRNRTDKGNKEEFRSKRG